MQNCRSQGCLQNTLPWQQQGSSTATPGVAAAYKITVSLAIVPGHRDVFVFHPLAGASHRGAPCEIPGLDATYGCYSCLPWLLIDFSSRLAYPWLRGWLDGREGRLDGGIVAALRCGSSRSHGSPACDGYPSVKSVSTYRLSRGPYARIVPRPQRTVSPLASPEPASASLPTPGCH